MVRGGCREKRVRWGRHTSRLCPLTPALSPTVESPPNAMPIAGERGQTVRGMPMGECTLRHGVEI